MDKFYIVTGVITLVFALITLSIVIATFVKNSKKDSKIDQENLQKKFDALNNTNDRLSRIEVDILYIREKLDKREEWEKSIESKQRDIEMRVQALEIKGETK